MLNAGPSGPPFAPYERPRASKLGRCRIEGIPEHLATNGCRDGSM